MLERRKNERGIIEIVSTEDLVPQDHMLRKADKAVDFRRLYLFELDTVAYFPLIRGRHSFDAVARIRDTTQLLLNVFAGGRYVYLHPLKVPRVSSSPA